MIFVTNSFPTLLELFHFLSVHRGNGHLSDDLLMARKVMVLSCSWKLQKLKPHAYGIYLAHSTVQHNRPFPISWI